MAGSGDMMDDMIRLAAKRNIADRFHFTGLLRGRQVYEMLADPDVYVMPSVSEPSESLRSRRWRWESLHHPQNRADAPKSSTM